MSPMRESCLQGSSAPTCVQRAIAAEVRHQARANGRRRAAAGVVSAAEPEVPRENVRLGIRSRPGLDDRTSRKVILTKSKTMKVQEGVS